MSTPIPIAKDESATFLVRWRGRQEGPYTAGVLETKIAANQIGMLHEIFHRGQWITIRDYVAEQEAVQRAQCQQREEEQSRAREQVERQNVEREEKYQLAALTETNRGSYLRTELSSARDKSQTLLASTYRLLLNAVCFVSFLAFFLPNVTISTPMLGTAGTSMFDFLSARTNSTSSTGKSEKPSVQNLQKLKAKNLTIGGALCVISMVGLLIHYLSTITWGILKFAFHKTHSTFNVVWLSLGLQFPILFSVGVHMTLAGLRNSVAQQAAASGSDIGTILGLALANNISIGPGVVMWILTGLALLAVGINTVEQTQRS